MTTSVWRLTIEKHTSMCVTICANQFVLLREIVEWKDYEQEVSDKQQEPESIGGQYTHPEGGLVRLVHGHCDSVDRAPTVLAYRFCDVTGMVLVEM